MARNKHPEETVKKILDVSMKLFLEKGYDHTTLSDIIQVSGLSKGAIYHHFASKAEILIRICDRIGEENAAQLEAVKEDRLLNGRQKLKAAFRASLLADNQRTMMNIVPTLTDNPQFLALEMSAIYEEAVPDYIEPIIREGISDGSICAEHPRETAEILIVLSDLWLNPVARAATPEEVRARCRVYNQITEGLGLGDMLDEDVIEALAEYAQQKREGI